MTFLTYLFLTNFLNNKIKYSSGFKVQHSDIYYLTKLCFTYNDKINVLRITFDI